MKKSKYQLTVSELKLQDRRIKITEEDVANMKRLRKQNLSYGKIAGILGFTFFNVYLHLNPAYYKKFKKCVYKNYLKRYQENKEQFFINQKKYYERKKKVIDSINTDNLFKKPVRNTIKNRILNFLSEDRDYKFSEIKDFLNKGYAYFSRDLHSLANKNLVKISGVKGNQFVRRIKNDK